MNHKPMPQFDDPYLQKYFEKAAKRDHKSELSSAGCCM